MERVKRIELSYSAWEAAVLPLYYTRDRGYFSNFTRKCQGFCHKRAYNCMFLFDIFAYNVKLSVKEELFMLHLTSEEKKVCWRLVRLGFYFIVLLGLMLAVWKFTDIWGRDTFSENGIVENLQWIFLAVAAVLFGWEAYQYKSYRTVLLGLMSRCLFALVREQDAWFDEQLPVISWRIGLIFPLIAVVYAGCHVKTLRRQLVAFFSMPAFYIVFAAMVAIVPVAQCLGHRPLIVVVMGFDDRGLGSSLRRLIEESIELLGYALILLVAFELYANIKEKITQ